MDQKQLIAPPIYNLATEIRRFADQTNRTALIYEDEQGTKQTIGYDELVKRSNKVSHALQSLGLKQGDIILVMVPRLIQAYTIYLGAIQAGITVIPSSEMLRAKDIDYRIVHSHAKAVVAYAPLVDEFEKAAHGHTVEKLAIGDAAGWLNISTLADAYDDTFDVVQTKASDMAFLSYTSGTTGQPKAAVHTHSWAYAHLRTASKNWLGAEEGKLVWATASPGWQKWIWSPFLSILGTGAIGFVYNGHFEPKKYLQLLQDYKVQALCCTPTEYRIMSKTEQLDCYDLSHLRSAVSAGEPLNIEVVDTFKRTFDLLVRDGYGQTENTLLVGTLLGTESRPGSMGKPTPGNRVEIVDEDGNVCADDVVGNIAVHRSTPALFKEYFEDPERTAQQFIGDYYITGDRAKRDADGYFWFEGRRDDIIISSGYTIGPFEVEDALVKHPAVEECAVVASPHELRGTIVKAFIVLKDCTRQEDPLFIKELQNFVKKHTAPYKYPRAIEFVKDLPKTTSGKIRRIELREAEYMHD